MRKRGMASSRLTEDGRCIVTTPGAGYCVGEVFYVLGSPATYGIAPSDWVLRLVGGYHSNGRPFGEGVDVRPAYEALLETLAAASPCRSRSATAYFDGTTTVSPEL
jgi:hypothetical protein